MFLSFLLFLQRKETTIHMSNNNKRDNNDNEKQKHNTLSHHSSSVILCGLPPPKKSATTTTTEPSTLTTETTIITTKTLVQKQKKKTLDTWTSLHPICLSLSLSLFITPSLWRPLPLGREKRKTDNSNIKCKSSQNTNLLLFQEATTRTLNKDNQTHGQQ